MRPTETAVTHRTRKHLTRILKAFVNANHPGRTLYNRMVDLSRVPLPLIPIFYGIRYTSFNQVRVLRAPYAEGDVNYFPEESSTQFERAIYRTSDSLRSRGFFWFTQSNEEVFLAICEMHCIRREILQLK